MKNLPHSYRATVAATAGLDTAWILRGDDLGDVFCAIPPEFEGPGSAWSPEHLFVGSAASCLAAMFKVLARNSRLSFSRLHVEGDGTLDRTDAGELRISRIDLHAELRIEHERDRARATRLLEKARESSILFRSLNAEVGFTFEVETETISEPVSALHPLMTEPMPLPSPRHRAASSQDRTDSVAA